jgi:rhodanese-related sulfurtransferase
VRHAEVRFILGGAGLAAGRAGQGDAAVGRIALADFKKLVDSGAVIVLDVRSADAYASGHIPGAISVPLETVAGRAADWRSATKPIVTYCT